MEPLLNATAPPPLLNITFSPSLFRPPFSFLSLSAHQPNRSTFFFLSLKMGIEDSSSDGPGHVIYAGDQAAASSSSSTVDQILVLLRSDDPDLRLEAAREIRRLTKTSQQYRRHFSGAVEPLVEMLGSGSDEAGEAALAALLNLAVKDEKNKLNIIRAGALKPITGFLQSENTSLQEYAVASLITLSASPLNKPTIASSGAIPHLIDILQSGGPQAKIDSVMALYNLSTHPESVAPVLRSNPISPLISLLKSCKRSSRTAEKCMALIESLVAFDEGRTVIASMEGGILAIVEVLEGGGGSLRSREHALGALLTMCESDRERYREPILGEGVIPGLLELTVQGTVEAQLKARTLLRLLRESPYPRPDTLENIVCDIICRIDGDDQTGKAKRMVSEMVQVSMEQSLRHLQQRASGVYTS